jgi:hypothetical protein
LDFDDLAPASILRDSNLVMFFNFFAQRTGLSIQSFECLTFRHSFAGNSVKVIHANDGNEAWEAFKRNLRRAFVYSRNKFPAKVLRRRLISGLRGVIPRETLQGTTMVGCD